MFHLGAICPKCISAKLEFVYALCLLTANIEKMICVDLLCQLTIDPVRKVSLTAVCVRRFCQCHTENLLLFFFTTMLRIFLIPVF